MNNLTLLQRFNGETPAFFKRVQLICLILSGALGWALPYLHVSQIIEGLIAGILGGIALIAQFAVTDKDLISKVIADPLSAIPALLDALPTLALQVSQLHGAIMKPNIVTMTDVEAALKKVVAPPVITPTDTVNNLDGPGLPPGPGSGGDLATDQ